MTSISARKSAHLSLCAEQDVEGRRSNLLEQVDLIHQALPELSFDEVDPSVEMLGRRLLAPLVVSGMSGGTPEARELNLALAAAAQKLGIGMGVGSQRPMLLHRELEDTYRVRDVAPDALLLANLGAVQLREVGPEAAVELAQRIGADALCIHLNAAQEIVQDEGDRDFRGCLSALGGLIAGAPLPIVVKETGCGLSPQVLRALAGVGARWVDVAGSGGTTWTGVEALRGSPRQQALGEALREWGIPTAPSVVFARRAGLRPIASGGVRGPLDVVRALALGAEAASLALPFLRAFAERGPSGVIEAGERLVEGVRAVMLLCGARRVDALPSLPRVLGPDLQRWIEDRPFVEEMP